MLFGQLGWLKREKNVDFTLKYEDYFRAGIALGLTTPFHMQFCLMAHLACTGIVIVTGLGGIVGANGIFNRKSTVRGVTEELLSSLVALTC